MFFQIFYFSVLIFSNWFFVLYFSPDVFCLFSNFAEQTYHCCLKPLSDNSSISILWELGFPLRVSMVLHLVILDCILEIVIRFEESGSVISLQRALMFFFYQAVNLGRNKLWDRSQIEVGRRSNSSLAPSA